MGVAQLFDLAEECGIGLGRGSERSQKTRLGNELRKARDRRFGPLKVEAAEKWKGAARWCLVKISDAGGEPGEPGEPFPGAHTRARVDEEGEKGSRGSPGSPTDPADSVVPPDDEEIVEWEG